VSGGAGNRATRRRGGWRVRLNDGREFTTRLLVGADGAQSKVRELAEIDTRRLELHQKALVANVRTAEPHQETAWQRFLPTGPLAFLPLHDGRCSIVWSTTPEQADSIAGAGRARLRPRAGGSVRTAAGLDHASRAARRFSPALCNTLAPTSNPVWP
jgi:2-polyprenyl-6-methoxyphenol hydroxylase-like FAD-dependent oxidoreductase